MNRINGNKEAEIFQKAVEAFRKNAPVNAKIEVLKAETTTLVAGLRPDYLLTIIVQGREFHYYAEIKTAVTKTNRLLMLMGRERLPHPLLVVARYINPQMAEQLRVDGMEFIDTAGNAFLNQPPLYVFIKGNRLPERHRDGQTKRAFKAAGLRLIFAFLCNTGLENRTFREIAAAAGVALGTVDWIIRELKELGYLLDMGKEGYRLIRKDMLLKRWVAAYPEQLRPRQMLGHYRGEQGWWQRINMDCLKAQWGGEVAAARMTDYLNPQTVTIYTTAPELNPLLIENRLRKDAAGDVEILERFWKPDEQRPDEELVHPILVYADLLATGDQRNIETARMIYEQDILRLVREN
ncbi:MAG: type IV toxin-antitoxin system AbiEi family antitoxin [Syntrophales bacterium]|nr:type IV toxin-antitoxin system AbiEi family antitoxin [Syntrophales bacterium]